MIYKNLTTEVLELVTESITEAKANGIIDNHPGILLKVILSKDTILRNILEDLEIDINGIFNTIEDQIKNDPIKYGEDADTSFGSFTPEYLKLFEVAHDLALRNQDKYLALDILIIAGISSGNSFFTYLDQFLDLELLEMYLKSLRGDRKINEKSFKEQSFLTTFCINLNEKYLAGECDLVHGRVDEIDRVANILSKRTKNNPILVGEPGVGKTAIAEGMAGKIVNHEIENLTDVIIWNLDLTALMSNAGKDEVAGRMNGLIKEIQRKNKFEDSKIVLFIDEIHLIVDNAGGMDLANILKPALARGELKTIGATTTKEYNKYFEKDAAIQRRFQLVKIDEPDEEQSLVILRGLREKIEEFHKIEVTDEALVSAVKLSKRYITDRFLPDKAIDLLDEAASVVSNSRFIESTEIKNLRLKIQEIEFKIKGIEKSIEASDKKSFISKQQTYLEELNQQLVTTKEELDKMVSEFQLAKENRQSIMVLKNEIKKAEQEAFEAKAELDLVKVIELEKNIIPKLLKEIKEIESGIVSISVQKGDISSVVENWTGIPMEKIKEEDSNENIKNILNLMKERVKGQDETLEEISKAIRRNSAGLSKEGKPVGSFMLLGPTGTGKTETAKSIAEIVFGDAKNMVRFDMSEFMEPHTVSKFIGSPAGYVGHDDGGQLTNAIKRNPYSLILFDEIEKAHPKIFDVLLQVLDDGRLRDGKGQVVDFSNTIIVFTSNIGGSDLANIPNKVVRDKEKMRLLQETYRPEFLNRLDCISVFNKLDMVNLIEILNRNLDTLAEKLWKDRYINIMVSDEFKAHLISSIDIEAFGARPLNRLISSEIEDKVTDLILDGMLEIGSEIIFEMADDKIIVEVV